MPRRLNQTTIDYVVIALSPALVMTLVGSLVFFLLAVFYQGTFPGRLHWVMFCFIFGAVLISRISIEEGFERAVPFGIAMGLAVGVAANRFMDVQGTPVDAFSWAINWGLIALIWWCAHKLTWDCTVMDESQDASGQGLLEIAGIEQSQKSQSGQEGSAARPAVEGTTARQVPEGWWQRYREHQRRPHAPGVWVVYFSLAALPLFGIGGWFIPAVDVGRRRYVFWLLAFYVASGMGLLLTTSFLGLRRYLRQRRIEMPAAMSGMWLSIGAVIIALLVVFAMLLPRPSAEYAVSQLPFSFGSPNQHASKLAPVPEEGTKDDQPGTAPKSTPDDEQEPPDEPPADSQAKGEPDDRQAGPAADSSKAETDPHREPPSNAPPQSGSQKSGSQKSASSKSEGKASGQGKSQGKSEAQSKSSQSKNDESRDARSDQEQKAKQDKPGDQKSRGSQSQNAEQKDEAPQKDSSQPQSDSQAETEPGEPLTDEKAGQEPPPVDAESETSETPDMEVPGLELAGGGIAELLKWVFYGVVVLAALYFLWRSRAEVFKAIREFLRGFGDLFAGLLGRRRPRVASAAAAASIEFPPTPFSTFADPFVAGVADRYSIDELVRYSFEAFEAWAREHGCPREPDQTPHELAREVSKLNKRIATDARNLAELYSRAAFADDDLPPTSADQLRQLWQAMRSGESAAW